MCELGAWWASAKANCIQQPTTNTSSDFDPESLDFEQTILWTFSEFFIVCLRSCHILYLPLYCKWELILDFNPNTSIVGGRALITCFYLSLFLNLSDRDLNKLSELGVSLLQHCICPLDDASVMLRCSLLWWCSDCIHLDAKYCISWHHRVLMSGEYKCTVSSQSDTVMLRLWPIRGRYYWRLGPRWLEDRGWHMGEEDHRRGDSESVVEDWGPGRALQCDH